MQPTVPPGTPGETDTDIPDHWRTALQGQDEHDILTFLTCRKLVRDKQLTQWENTLGCAWGLIHTYLTLGISHTTCRTVHQWDPNLALHLPTAYTDLNRNQIPVTEHELPNWVRSGLITHPQPGPGAQRTTGYTHLTRIKEWVSKFGPDAHLYAAAGLSIPQAQHAHHDREHLMPTIRFMAALNTPPTRGATRYPTSGPEPW